MARQPIGDVPMIQMSLSLSGEDKQAFSKVAKSRGLSNSEYFRLLWTQEKLRIREAKLAAKRGKA